MEDDREKEEKRVVGPKTNLSSSFFKITDNSNETCENVRFERKVASRN